MNIYKKKIIEEAESPDFKEEKVYKTEPDPKNPFYRRAIYWGIGAGILMSLFVFLPGFYINGDHPGYGFAKYLVLLPIIYFFLRSVQRDTVFGKTFRPGFAMGLVLSAAAALTNVLAAILFGGQSVIRGTADEASEVIINRMTLATMTFFETMVAGLIITFIFLQFIKDNNVTK